MAVGFNNIFPLDNPQEYSCAVFLYEIGHLGMYIRVSRKKEMPFYLYFPLVRYFSGPTSWQGADFQLAAKPDEHLNWLGKIGYYGNWPRDVVLDEHFQIFTIVPPGGATIVIVAGDVEKLDRPPNLVHAPVE